MKPKNVLLALVFLALGLAVVLSTVRAMQPSPYQGQPQLKLGECYSGTDGIKLCNSYWDGTMWYINVSQNGQNRDMVLIGIGDTKVTNGYTITSNDLTLYIKPADK